MKYLKEMGIKKYEKVFANCCESIYAVYRSVPVIILLYLMQLFFPVSSIPPYENAYY